VTNQPTASDAYSLAQSALDRIDRHEQDCVERGRRMERNQEDAKVERKEMHRENQASLAKINERVDRIYGRERSALIALAVLLGGGLLYFVKAYLESHQ
jgi:hypothetical protein